MFRLVYVSLWTTYTVETFTSVEKAEDYAARHYKARGLTFKRDTDGILKAMLDADGEVVILNLYENEPDHAPVYR
jgi:hypothetical protein